MPSLTLEREELTTVVRRATDTPTAQVVSWRINQLTGGRETVSRIYAVDVKVALPMRAQPVDLRLVLKLVRMTAERRSPDHWNYWLREANAYASGALADLPPGLSAPACYAVEIHDDVAWIWLAHMSGEQETNWTEIEIGAVCFELGRFNGAYLADTALPTGAWATRNWLRQYVAVNVPYLEQLPQLQDHWLVGQSVSPQLLSDLLRLVAEREQWLGLLDNLPQVFCHQDIHRGNLFLTRPSPDATQLVAIDWSFAGVAALGQELAAIFFTNRRLPNIYELATQNYIAGLRAVGWQGDETIILWSSAISAALNYGVAMVGLFIGNLLDEDKHAELIDGYGITIDQVPPRVNRWVEFGLDYANLARKIAQH